MRRRARWRAWPLTSLPSLASSRTTRHSQRRERQRRSRTTCGSAALRPAAQSYAAGAWRSTVTQNGQRARTMTLKRLPSWAPPWLRGLRDNGARTLVRTPSSRPWAARIPGGRLPPRPVPAELRTFGESIAACACVCARGQMLIPNHFAGTCMHERSAVRLPVVCVLSSTTRTWGGILPGIQRRGPRFLDEPSEPLCSPEQYYGMSFHAHEGVSVSQQSRAQRAAPPPSPSLPPEHDGAETTIVNRLSRNQKSVRAAAPSPQPSSSPPPPDREAERLGKQEEDRKRREEERLRKEQVREEEQQGPRKEEEARVRPHATRVDVAGRSPLQGQGGAGKRTLISSGLFKTPEVGSRASWKDSGRTNWTESEGNLRTAFGICDHGKHRSQCRMCEAQHPLDEAAAALRPGPAMSRRPACGSGCVVS